MYSSRKYNVKRHIQNVHNGNGHIVSFIDYEVGRRNGIYPPVLPPLYIKKSSVTTIPKIRPIDVLQNEFLKALAWKAVDKNLFPKQQQQQQPPLQQLQQQHLLGPNANNIQPQVTPSYHLSSFVPELEDIFGFEACVCGTCSAVKTIMICYANESDECGQVRIGITCCNSMELPNNNISKKVNEVDKQMSVKILKNVVDLWTKNNDDDNNKKTLVVALKLSSDKIIMGNHKIKVVKCENPSRSITLQYLEEKCIELTNPADENYWAIRAIKNKQTTLDNEELIDFLQKVGNATFGFFNVKSQLYLMAIAVIRTMADQIQM